MKEKRKVAKADHRPERRILAFAARLDHVDQQPVGEAVRAHVAEAAQRRDLVAGVAVAIAESQITSLE